MTFGFMWCVGGIIVTAGTYLAAASGETYVVAWGAIVFGAIQFIRGSDQKRLARQAAAGDQPSNVDYDLGGPPLNCPRCGALYRLSDYRADASRWLCSECKAVLRELPSPSTLLNRKGSLGSGP